MQAYGLKAKLERCDDHASARAAGGAVQRIAEGQVVALADIYDALRAKRVYKGPLGHGEVVRILQEGDGRTQPEHFSPTLRAFFSECHLQMADIFERALLLSPPRPLSPEKPPSA